MELRVFTKTDWEGFAGCESRKPMIGKVSMKDTEEAEGIVEGIVVVDGLTVEMYFLDEKCIDEVIYSKDFIDFVNEDIITIVKSWPKMITKDFVVRRGFEEF